MATLYVDNFPDDLYRALRNRSKSNHRSMAAEVISILKEEIPTPQDLRRREALFKRVKQLQARKGIKPGTFSSTEEIVREGRDR